MKVEVITPDRAVVVGPEEPTVEDVLEYAEVLIEEEGWNPGKSVEGMMTESSPEQGWTLHDAIGEANTRLYPKEMGGGGKEGIALEAHGHQTTRQVATAAVVAALPASAKGDDKAFNDKAKGAADVIKVLRKAREAVAAA